MLEFNNLCVHSKRIATSHTNQANHTSTLARTYHQWLTKIKNPVMMNDALSAHQRILINGMMPTLNSILVVGIVSLPGMMTGQILAGADPTQAVRYQNIQY